MGDRNMAEDIEAMTHTKNIREGRFKGFQQLARSDLVVTHQ